MMDEYVRGITGFEQIAVVARQLFEPLVCRLDENLRAEPCMLEHSLYAEHLMTYGIAIAKRR